jgi:uncharacterized repeat protein (TIGR03803 family)
MTAALPRAFIRSAGFAVALAALGGSALLRAQPTYEVFHQCVTPGGEPYGPLLVESDGRMYGTMRSGGTLARGSIFVLAPDGGGGYTYADLWSFSGPDGSFPSQGVSRGPDGALYGSTSQGGGQAVGTFFRLDSRNRLTVIHHIAVGEVASASPLTLGPDGAFYGTSEGGGFGGGSLFRLSLSGTFTGLYDFPGGADGALPRGGVVVGPDGRLYGTTASGGPNGVGTIFAATTGGTVTTLHAFAIPDGAQPQWGVALGPDGLLYGTTSGGGVSSFGTVFRITTAGAFTKLFDFPGTAPQGGLPASRLVLALDGKLYGTTNSIEQGGILPPIPRTLFRVDSSGAVTTINATGASAMDGPMVLGPDGLLYAGAAPGAPSPVDDGAILRMDLTGVVTTVYTVPFVAEAQRPYGPLIELPDRSIAGLAASVDYGGDILYGLDAQGQTSTLHVFDNLTVVHEILLASDGLYYGTVGYAPGEDFGALLRIEANGSETTLHAFDGTDGQGPFGLFELSGEIWGMTSMGGSGAGGTIFKLDAGRTFHDLHDFTDPGTGPSGRFALGSDGNLYGTTLFSDNGGTLFRADPAGSVTIIHDFTGTDGTLPAWLIAASDGFLYGVTQGNGGPDQITAFRADLTGALTPLGTIPGFPNSYLTEADPGSFYGTKWGGGGGFPPDDGSVFRMDSTGQVTDVHDFFGDFENLSTPLAPLLLASDGSLYGTTRDGGFAGVGGIFRMVPGTTPPPALTAIVPTSGSAAGGAGVVASGHHFRAAFLSFGGIQAVTTFIAREALATTVSPALPPGTVQDVTVTNVGDANVATLPAAFFVDFLDVANDQLFHDYIETLVRNGITAGCGGGDYCPTSPVRRDQMAVFLLKAEHGSDYVPPPCHGMFSDVPCPSPFADWVEQLAAEGITGGCGGGDYCPTSPVRRDQMAAFLLKAEHGSGYVPPPCQGIFADVNCPSAFADWIEQLAAEQITGGCGGGNYCPGNPNTRGQMAVFLTKTFGLP